LLRNIGSNWALLILNVGATYVMTPFIIHRLGNDGYGTWTLITAIAGYIGLLALGVPMASVRYLAQHLARGDMRQVNKTIGSCAALYLVVGTAAMIVAGALIGTLGSFRIPAGLETQAHVTFAVMAIYLAGGFVGLLPEGIMVAHHDFVLRNAVRILALLLRFGLTIGLLSLRPSLVLLALVQVTCLAFDISLSVYLIRRRYPQIRISLADFEWATVRRILSFSAYVLLLTAGARLSFETDAIVIGRFLDVSAIPFYAVANSLIVYLMDFIISIAVVVSPMATTLHTDGQMDALREMFLKWSKIALSLTLMGGVFLIVMGPRFIGWWIGESYEGPAGQVLQILMASTFLFLPVRGVAQPILVGIGKPQAPAIGFLATGVLNLVMSIGLARPFGLMGVAIGTAVPSALFAVIVLVVACRELDVGVWQYVGYVVPRAAAGAVPLVALLVWCRIGLQVQSLLGLAASGIAAVALFGLTCIVFVYHRDPFVNLMPHVGRIRSWSRV
jgi:O-antigen/teichoic acid export membrane protein